MVSNKNSFKACKLVLSQQNFLSRFFLLSCPVVFCVSFMRTLGTGGKLGSLGALQGSLGDTGAWDLLSRWEARVSKVSSGLRWEWARVGT